MSKHQDEQTPMEAEILREVAEEIKEEQLKELFKKLKPIVTTVITIVLLATAGFEFYKHQDKQKSLQESEQLQTALMLMENGEGEKASQMLKDLSETSSRGYGYLATFHYADYLLLQGDEGYTNALDILGALADNQKAPKSVRQMALFDKISLQMEKGNGDFEQMQKQLDLIITNSDAWSPLALDLSAAIALKQGDTDKAISRWNQMLEMPNVSEAKRKQILDFISFVEKTKSAKK